MLFERPKGGERAVLVHVDFADSETREDPAEFEELAVSAGAEIVEVIVGHRKVPDARTFVGSGKVAEIGFALQASGAQLVLFNHALSPSQERNLERELSCRVLDRTGLILDIFAQRARTHEGKLQVELAQLEHMSTRLVRGWTHLERQKGGIGLRGPGETQLETDRRLLRARIKAINARLEKVRGQRAQGRRALRRADVPSVTLVGYTNAGKSTLFNALTQAQVYAADQLFATLDPTLRRLELEGLGHVVMADTVGFIRHLPHKLVEAFRATLEQAAQADLLLHVIDAADDERLDHVEQVERVLAEIGAEAIPVLAVYNKIDLLGGMSARIDRDEDGQASAVWLSASSGDGLALLPQAIAERLGAAVVHQWVELPSELSRLRARLYDVRAVVSEVPGSGAATRLELKAPAARLRRVFSREGADMARYVLCETLPSGDAG